MPLFLLGGDGTVRRVNAAAGDLLGSGPGYATGKAFTAFIDLPSRPAAATHFAAAPVIICSVVSFGLGRGHRAPATTCRDLQSLSPCR